MSQVTTITFFKMNSLSAKVWAFFMMQFGPAKLAKIEGQEFYKLMGSGRGLGFNPRPDWSVYVLLQIWNDVEYAEVFLRKNKFLSTYKDKAHESATVFLRNIASHGTWDGKNPFQKVMAEVDESKPRVILTRATIKRSKLRKFWSYVPTSQKPIQNAKGLIYTKGVGELPLIQMATLSAWESQEDMMAFAYSSEEHRKAIQLTRELNWYKEELFARFIPFKVQGKFEGLTALKSLL